MQDKQVISALKVSVSTLPNGSIKNPYLRGLSREPSKTVHRENILKLYTIAISQWPPQEGSAILPPCAGVQARVPAFSSRFIPSACTGSWQKVPTAGKPLLTNTPAQRLSGETPGGVCPLQTELKMPAFPAARAWIDNLRLTC